MAVGLQRASILAVVEETTTGELKKPSAASEFIPLRPGFSLEYAAEELTNEELLNDIGLSKSFKGKESVNGEHPAYLKHSGVEGQEPEVGVLYESIMGAKSVASTEYDTVSSSTTTLVKVNTGEGANFEVGECLLVKDATNGYSMRNIKSISGDDLTINFALDNAPASGVNLGKAILYKPAASGEPSFSVWAYRGNGHVLEAAAGCKTTELSVELAANQFGNVTFSYQGTKYYYNPIEITSSDVYIDWTDDDGTFAAQVAQGFYRTPSELADALQAAMNASASTESFEVTFNNTTGKFRIATTTSTVFSILWNTGTNAANNIASQIGFLVAANDTGATFYNADNELTYTAAYTPSYDSADAIIAKDAEFFVGSQDMTLCLCATTATLTVTKEIVDVDCICEETGTKEKIATGREITIEAEVVLEKHQQQLFEYILNNDSVAAMLNAGPKSSGNWIAGKCFNVYLGNATVTSFSVTGDDFITASVTVRGFVSSTLKDGYINFV